MSNQTEEIEELKKELKELKEKKSWFGKLSWWQKFLASLVSISVSIGAIGIILEQAAELVFHEEIEAWEDMQEMNVTQTLTISTISSTLDSALADIDTIKNTERKGSSYYAVGYRAMKTPNGEIKKYYRDWKGNVHNIFPDPQFSTSSYTYYFYNNVDGTKQYTFSK